jgi:exopolysaccharide biosynthesis protein
MGFLKKPFRWAVLYALILTVATTAVMLDTFVIPRALTADTAAAYPVASASAETSLDTTQAVTLAQTANASQAVVTATSYTDDHIRITLEQTVVYNTAVYIADIQVSDVSYLKTALANGVYGRNIKETTSAMAEENNAIFAINGDYYGFRNDGYVIRDGVLYRETSGDREDLMIDGNGDFSIVEEKDTTAQSLLQAGAWQVLSFGPALVNNGQIVVTANSEVSQSKSSNPRTAIGQISALHYLVIGLSPQARAAADENRAGLRGGKRVLRPV